MATQKGVLVHKRLRKLPQNTKIIVNVGSYMLSLLELLRIVKEKMAQDYLRTTKR